MAAKWYVRQGILLGCVAIGMAQAEAAKRLTKNEAFAVAQPVLEEMIRGERSGWNAHSRLVGAYPVYVEGLDGVSYYEVKVTTGDRDAGYILVNANRSDIEVPELITHGPTLTELYQRKAQRADIRMYRYDAFRTAVKGRDPATGQIEIVAALGFDSTPRIQLLVDARDPALASRVKAFDAQFQEAIRQKGCLPYLLKAPLDRYYADLAASARDVPASVGVRSPDGGPMSPADTSTYHYLQRVFRADGGVPVTGDFSRDPVSIPNDVALFDPRDGTWDFDYDHDGSTDQETPAWSNVDDIQFAGDFDRDGDVDDLGVLRASSKNYYFDYDHNGTTNATVTLRGTYDQMRAVAGDFNCDGYMDDIAMFSYNTRRWYFDIGHDGIFVNGSQWGIAGDIPLCGDFDRDGFVDDVGVFRPSTRIWYFDYDRNGTTNDTSGPWAIDGDKPFAIDADFDGFADDVGVYRSSSGMWYYDADRRGSTSQTRGPWGATGPYWRLPSWNQPHDAADYPVGCANTAWAMVYAYWQQFKGKTNLFPGLNLQKLSRASGCTFGGPVSNVMWEIGRLTETTYGEDDEGKYGSTKSYDMPQGIEYAQNQGYATASCVRWRGGERSKWDAIDGEILADRPVSILFCHDGTGSSDHFVGIEATVYVSRSGSDAIGYLANYGWGENAEITLKWIFSRPTWYDPHHSIYDAYFTRF